MQDKGLAKLGDNLVNLIYSLGKSRVLGQPTGWKVSARVLGSALKQSSFSKVIPRRASMHDLGDFYEALCAHAWLTKRKTFEEMVNIIYSALKNGDFSSRKKEDLVAVEAFSQLLIKIEEDYEI